MGPQVTNYTSALQKLMHNSKMHVKSEVDEHCVDERLGNLEDLLRIKPNKVQTVFARLKNIEDRLLHLESSSPEYRHFIVSGSFVACYDDVDLCWVLFFLFFS